MIVSAIEMNKLDPLACADEGACRLQKKSGPVDLIDQIAMVQLFLRQHFFQVLLVIYRCGDKRARVRDGAEQANPLERFGSRLLRLLLQGGPQLRKILDEGIEDRERISPGGKLRQQVRYVVGSFFGP